jgi:hypothetical protein
MGVALQTCLGWVMLVSSMLVCRPPLSTPNPRVARRAGVPARLTADGWACAVVGGLGVSPTAIDAQPLCGARLRSACVPVGVCWGGGGRW